MARQLKGILVNKPRVDQGLFLIAVENGYNDNRKQCKETCEQTNNPLSNLMWKPS